MQLSCALSNLNTMVLQNLLPKKEIKVQITKIKQLYDRLSTCYIENTMFYYFMSSFTNIPIFLEPKSEQVSFIDIS